MCKFGFALRGTASRVEQRIATYEQMLRGIQGLFSVITISERERLAGYVDSLLPDTNFSGIQAIGIAELVTAERKDAHMAAMHRLGFPDYEIQPAGQRPLYGPIVLREPNIGPNRVRPGFDGRIHDPGSAVGQGCRRGGPRPFGRSGPKPRPIQRRSRAVRLSDNGIGIDPDYHGKIFEIFQRLAPSGETEGTGIGLTLCRRIVHRFGGTIWLESEPGHGMTFFFTLRDAALN